MKNFNSACTFSFTIDHDKEDVSDVSDAELIAAVRARLDLLEKQNTGEIREAVLPPYDTVTKEDM